MGAQAKASGPIGVTPSATCRALPPGTSARFKVATRDEAVDMYEGYLAQRKDLVARLGELEDQTLGCFCKPKRCHGDVLVEYVNMLRLSTEELLEKRYEARRQRRFHRAAILRWMLEARGVDILAIDLERLGRIRS